MIDQQLNAVLMTDLRRTHFKGCNGMGLVNDKMVWCMLPDFSYSEEFMAWAKKINSKPYPTYAEYEALEEG